MFRRNVVSMILMSVMTLATFEVFASGRHKETKKSSNSSRGDRAGLQLSAVGINPAVRRAKILQDAASEWLVSDAANLPPYIKAQLSKAGIKGTRSQGLIMRLVNVVSGKRQTVPAEEHTLSFNPAELMALLQDADTVEKLITNLKDALLLIDNVLEKRAWQVFAPVEKDLGMIRLQLYDLHTRVNDAVETGRLFANASVGLVTQLFSPAASTVAPVSSDDTATAAETVEVAHGKHVLHSMFTAVAAHKGALLAAGATGLCFVIAGVYFPVILPAMYTGSMMGAGVGGLFGAACGRSVRATAEGVVFGAFGGAIAPGVSTAVGLSQVSAYGPVALRAVEGSVVGGTSGFLRGMDHGSALKDSVSGVIAGGVFGALFAGAEELWARFARLEMSTVPAVQQREIERLSEEVRALQAELAARPTADRVAELERYAAVLNEQVRGLNTTLTTEVTRLSGLISGLQAEVARISPATATKLRELQSIIEALGGRITLVEGTLANGAGAPLNSTQLTALLTAHQAVQRTAPLSLGAMLDGFYSAVGLGSFNKPIFS